MSELDDLKPVTSKVTGRGIIQNASDIMNLLADNGVINLVNVMAREYRSAREAIEEDRARRERQANKKVEETPVPTGKEIKEAYKEGTYRGTVGGDER